MKAKTLMTIPMFLAMAGSIYLSIVTFDMVKAKENLEHPSQITMKLLRDSDEAGEVEYSPEEILIDEPETIEEEKTDAAEQSEDETAGTIDTAEETEALEDTAEETEAPEDTVEETEAPGEAVEEIVDPSVPVLTLKESQIEIRVGESFSVISAVEDITDDVDSRSDLFRRIRVHGDYNLQVAGTYQLEYIVSDYQGHDSLPKILTLIVKAD